MENLFSSLTPLGKADRPVEAEDARRSLDEGNAQFAQWVSQQSAEAGGDAEQLEMFTGLTDPASVSTQTPFGVVIGCSDARVPVRLALGQKANRLFEIRVAGNVLADECLGSVDYALHHLPSVKTVVVLGHSHCGAVTAAVDAFLRPASINAKELSVGLRAIVQRLLGPVALASASFQKTQSAASKESPAYRQQLIDAAIHVHAATAASDLQAEVAQSGRSDVSVLFGAIDLADYIVRSPQRDQDGSPSLQPGLSLAPTASEALEEIANMTVAAIANRQQTA